MKLNGEDIQKRIFKINSVEEFHELAVAAFQFQAQSCSVYKDFLKFMNVDVRKVDCIEQIPFLPVEFFKTHTILADGYNPSITFLSSSTTGTGQSMHYVANVDLYVQSFVNAFNHFYGAVNDFVFLALLPSYQERNGSSLIYMVDELIKRSGHAESGYFLNNDAELNATIYKLYDQQKKVVLIGVSYALLDFIEKYQPQNPDLIVMETGGMKGRRKELIKEELHDTLKKGFGVKNIHSEYSMTELLSQAYSKGDGIYKCPPWMRVLTRDINEPQHILSKNQSGGICIIDLANIYSCSFIATQDLGKVYADNSFEVLGRFDNSDLRGCNLLVQ